jgi:hypothetical protein
MVKDTPVERMAAEQDILKHDLAILTSMAKGMDEYLRSDATWWDMGRPDMPLLTIGGYLMRRRRLALVEYLLHESEQEELAMANAHYDKIVSGQIVRFEERALAEIGARMREWTVYLRDLMVSHRLAADTARYDYLADTRVVIGELVNKLSESPFKLPEHIPNDIAALDHRLGARWSPGAFIWAPVWTPAYSPDSYWWLYGHPKAG